MLSLTCASVDPCQRGGLSRRSLCRPRWRRGLAVRCRIPATPDVYIRSARVSTRVENTEPSRRHIQVSSLLEVVSGDLKRLIENLKSMSIATSLSNTLS